LGDVSVRVFEHHLVDRADTKDLVGSVPGLESAYKVKRAVSELKDAIRIYADNDPELTRRSEGLVSRETRRCDRRFGRVAAVEGSG
jgi:hypothetical protein